MYTLQDLVLAHFVIMILEKSLAFFLPEVKEFWLCING